MLDTGIILTQGKSGKAINTFELLRLAGYTTTSASGLISFLPLGLRVLLKSQQFIRQSLINSGYSEILLPILQRKELWERSGRYEDFKEGLCFTRVGSSQNFVLNPTQEEAVLEIVHSLNQASAQTPIKWFQISERVRNELRPAHGLIRSRSFQLADVYVVAQGKETSDREFTRLTQVFNDLCNLLPIPTKTARYLTGDTVEKLSFFVSSESVQCTAFCCDSCGSYFRFKPDLDKRCIQCGSAKFSQHSGTEIADVINLNDSMSHNLGVRFADGQHPHLVMAGFGVSKLIQLIAEHNRDGNGLVWPRRFAPFQVHLVFGSERRDEGLALDETLTRSGYDVLSTEVRKSFGSTLFDSDLIGIPLRIVLGQRTAQGIIEYKNRLSGNTDELDTNVFLEKIEELF